MVHAVYSPPPFSCPVFGSLVVASFSTEGPGSLLVPKENLSGNKYKRCRTISLQENGLLNEVSEVTEKNYTEAIKGQ